VNRVPIVIEPEAKSDIRVARDYYSDKGENTSERFRDELNQVHDLLTDQNSGITPPTGDSYKFVDSRLGAGVSED